MRIGVDAKCIFNNNNPSGKTVITNLIKELLKLNDDNYYYIFLNRKHKKLPFPYNSNRIKLVYIWGGIDSLSTIIVLPIVSWKYKLDICLFQYFIPIVSNFKKIVFIHDCIYKSHPQYFSFIEKLYYFPIKPLSHLADVVVTISNSEKERLRKYSFSKDPSEIKVIYLGCNSEFKPKGDINESIVKETKKKYNLPDRYLLYVGRLNERKNILNLLKSIAYLKDKKIKLILVGKYNRKMFDLPLVLEKLGIGNRVIILDYVEDHHLQIIYSLATVFCYLSFQEGFGMPPLEAMACGIPIVIPNSSSLPEICGRAGTYCDPLAPEDIASKIDILLSDAVLYNTKKDLGLRKAQEFSWSKSAMELKKIFDSMQKENSDGGRQHETGEIAR